MATVNFDLNTYKTRFTGGARQYLFYAFIQFPQTRKSGSYGTGSDASGWQKIVMPMAKSVLTLYGLGAANDKWPYLVKSTSIPESTLDEIIIPWQHLDYKMAGQTRYGDWPVTFYVDEEYALLKKLKDWQELAHGFPGDESAYATHYGATQYRTTQELHLINYSGDVVMSVEMVSAWPKIIGQVSYDYASGEIVTVDVTFTYAYHKLTSSPSSEVSNILKRGYEKVSGLVRR